MKGTETDKKRWGGRRKGSGRPKLKTVREVKERLQKSLPEAVRVIEAGVKAGKEASAWKLVSKFVPDQSASTVDLKETSTVIVVEDVGYNPDRKTKGKPIAYQNGTTFEIDDTK